MPAVYMLSGLVIGCLGFQLAVGKRRDGAVVVSRSGRSTKRCLGFQPAVGQRRGGVVVVPRSRRSERTVVLGILGVASLLSIAWWLGAIAGLLGRC